MKGGLDETGVFGSTCARHGFPLFFISMTTGEIFDYPISILNRIKQRYGTNIGVLYDVACKLKPSLEQVNYLKLLLKDIPMAVSVWHAYNHVPQCQIDFHPRLLPNYGMTDGEWLERLWSYTNPFVPQTKYSGPNHRKLTLTCAFNTFKKEKITNIGMFFISYIIFKIYLDYNTS
ncbi:hypothetical protein BDC45DRAFT_580393 [Circinella umbellata]|nr:hypothetical protein BDC45DRAFT_580393 [Circinella umbellata]